MANQTASIYRRFGVASRMELAARVLGDHDGTEGAGSE